MKAIRKVLETLRNVFSVPELRAKILFTIAIVLVYRFGAQIPVPYVNADQLEAAFSAYSNTIFTYLNLLSGSAFSRATLLALSISPYITSSIVMQLLCVAIPALERMSKEDDGREKIQKITRFVTVGLGIITAVGYYVYLNSQNLISLPEGMPKWFAAVVMIACYSAGAAIVMWLGEKINERGVGNGISIILFANIVSSGPSIASGLFDLFTDWGWNTLIAVIGLVLGIGMIVFMVFVSESERRLPVQYAKRVVGRKMYGGQSTNLPIKLNMSGVMPIIFANSIVAIPATIGTMLGKTVETPGFWGVFLTLFNVTSFLDLAIYLILLVLFAYFYIAISFNPVEVANNLKKNGGFIPGIRPGRPTVEYITKILNRITFIGAAFLAIISGLPLLINCIASLFEYNGLSAIAFGGSSLLIVVGVALETARDIEGQMTMRHFKGFLE